MALYFIWVHSNFFAQLTSTAFDDFKVQGLCKCINIRLMLQWNWSSKKSIKQFWFTFICSHRTWDAIFRWMIVNVSFWNHLLCKCQKHHKHSIKPIRKFSDRKWICIFCLVKYQSCTQIVSESDDNNEQRNNGN